MLLEAPSSWSRAHTQCTYTYEKSSLLQVATKRQVMQYKCQASSAPFYYAELVLLPPGSSPPREYLTAHSIEQHGDRRRLPPRSGVVMRTPPADNSASLGEERSSGAPHWHEKVGRDKRRATSRGVGRTSRAMTGCSRAPVQYSQSRAPPTPLLLPCCCCCCCCCCCGQVR